MSETIPTPEADDTEGHRLLAQKADEGDDVEGHRYSPKNSDEGDDVEGHLRAR